MKVIVLGAGNIGSIATQDLAKTMPSAEFVVADVDKNRASSLAERMRKKRVLSIKLDATNRKQLLQTLKGFDLVMGFLPGNLGYTLMKACIKARRDLVDVSYMAENPLNLNAIAKKAGILIVPDCGLAPGISNFLVGHAYGKLDKLRTVHIMVGGLPEKPTPPLDYIITWSTESLIDEYTRKAIIIRQGKRIKVDALSGTETIEVPRIGKLEAFYTDGLRTIAQTIDGEDMWEKTLRYPGHTEKIKVLQALGFFGKEKIKVGKTEVSPRQLTEKLLQQKLHKTEIKDFVALKVEVCGIEKGKKTCYTYNLLEKYDELHETTAMAGTTAYPPSIVAELILNRVVEKSGVVPPELLGMDVEVYEQFLNGLKKRGINVIEEKSTR
jgi:lysine 6-dehydrogenase